MAESTEGTRLSGYIQLAVVAVVLAVGIYFGQAPIESPAIPQRR